jgi:hypothetical protein
VLAVTLAAGMGSTLLAGPTVATAGPVTAADHSSVIAIEGPDNSLDFYWQAFGTTPGSTPWREEVVAGPGTTFSAPSVSTADNSTVIVAQGASNSLDFYWQSYGTTTWSSEMVAGPATTFSPPSIAAANNTSVIAALGPANTLDFYWHYTVAGQWYPEMVAGPATSFSPPTVSAADGASVIAVQGPANSLDFYWQSYGTVPWDQETVAGPGTTFGTPSVTAADNTSVIAAQGPTNSLDFYTHTVVPGPWRQQTVAGPGTTFSAPAVSADDNTSVIVAQGPNSSLDLYWQTTSSPPWYPEVVAGPQSTPGPPSVGAADNSSVIAAPGAGNSLDFYWQAYNSFTWHPEVVTSSGYPAPTTAPTTSVAPPPLPPHALCTAPARWATVLQLRTGCSDYLYVGSNSGGAPIFDMSWASDLSVTASFSGNPSVSIGRSGASAGGFFTLSHNVAIAGVGLKGYSVMGTFVAQTSQNGPGCSGCGLKFVDGPDLQLRFHSDGSGPVLILVGGQGTGTLVLSGLTTYALANGTFSGGSGVLASAAIFKATLPAGWYTARFTSRTTLNNSGASLGAIAYQLS